MQIERVQNISPESLGKADFSFDVEEEATPPFDGPGVEEPGPCPELYKAVPRQRRDP
jgi:hypothetical protein